MHGRNLQQLSNNISMVRHEHHLNLQLKSGELRRLLLPGNLQEEIEVRGLGRVDMGGARVLATMLAKRGGTVLWC